MCAQTFGDSGGVFCNLLPEIDCPREDVETKTFLVYSVSGESYIYEGDTFEARPQDFEFGSKFFSVAEKLWAQGRWQPHPLRLEPGGLQGIIDGMQQMREGKVSGEKLVYRVDDTEWPE